MRTRRVRVLMIDTLELMLELGRPLGLGFRFLQIDLNYRLILFECRRDDKEDEQDDENIDQRNNNDGGCPAFADDKVHGLRCADYTTGVGVGAVVSGGDFVGSASRDERP